MRTSLTCALAVGLIGGVMAGSGCEKKEPAAQVTASDGTGGLSDRAGIPAAMFAGEAPEVFGTLHAAKHEASVGDRVVFEAKVGGRVAPFVEGRAIMVVADTDLLSCDQLPGDNCTKPWDYCCEAPESLLANTATIQVVGDDGRPLKASLRGAGGLEELTVVVVTGTVAQRDDAGTFVVNAERLQVRQ